MKEDIPEDKLSLLSKYSEGFLIDFQVKSGNKGRNNENQNMPQCEKEGCVNEGIFS